MKQLTLLTTVLLSTIALTQLYAQSNYRINATGQSRFYDAQGNSIEAPIKGDALYGQDAHYLSGSPMLFVDNGDGTVVDSNTGLMWQQTPPMEGMTWAEAKAYCEALELGGYTDWRLPSLKELFSISNFENGWPYVDTAFFNLSNGQITKDEQYWADNKYVGETVEGRDDAAFGVNHVTGHIKAYPAGSDKGAKGANQQDQRQGQRQGQGQRQRQRPMMPPPLTQGGEGGAPAMRGNPMAKQVRAVRGDVYGQNNFCDNGDGTISDTATGLMWAKEDSGRSMEWVEALPYAEASELAGYNDWRLPNVKELQSIVDYSHAPSSKSLEAAIDARFFGCTPFVNEAGDDDYGYYWTSTSACFTSGRPFYFAWYVAFGRAVNGSGADFHGAGAVRFDAKSNNGISVEGDEERYYNFVRLVRNIENR